jgi:TRAP-type mannitol/chloroaromatic compound transport system permease large subunit
MSNKTHEIEIQTIFFGVVPNLMIEVEVICLVVDFHQVAEHQLAPLLTQEYTLSQTFQGRK